MTRLLKSSLVPAMVAGLLFCAGDASGEEPAAQAAQASTAGCPDEVRHNASREALEFQSGSDTIRGYIYKPGIPNGVGIVLLHGPQGLPVDAPRFDPHAVQLASRGYLVLVPSYFDARPWPRQGVSGREMTEWARAGADAVRYAGAQAGVDPARVTLWGYSYGGYLATDGSVREDAPAAVAIGVSTGQAIWNQNDRGRREIPVLMVHGRADAAVTPSSMRDLAANLRRRGATVQIETIDAQTHAYDGPVWCDVFRYTREFLETHLQAPAA